MSQPLLSVNGLMMRFGGLLAVNNVNLELYPQEIVSLIGRRHHFTARSASGRFTGAANCPHGRGAHLPACTSVP